MVGINWGGFDVDVGVFVGVFVGVIVGVGVGVNWGNVYVPTFEGVPKELVL
jgi:hypothetical protein